VSVIDVVIKVGGSLLGRPTQLDAVASALANLHERYRLVVVPGGGPMADTIRALDRRLALDDDTSHWMAVLAMDQYAQLLAARIRGAVLVHDPAEIAGAHSRGELPVLAPYRWLRETDPLPHSWSVTSDSIAAWVAKTLDARRLVLVKPASGAIETMTDEHFAEHHAPRSDTLIVSANDIEQLESLLAIACSQAGVVETSLDS